MAVNPFQSLIDDEEYQKLLGAIAKRTVQAAESFKEGQIVPIEEIKTGLEQPTEEERELSRIKLSKENEQRRLIEEEYGAIVPNVTHDTDGNMLISPTDKPIQDRGEVGIGVNYTKQDLINHYKSLPGWNEKSDDRIYNLIKQHQPELIEPLEYEPEWGGGFAWNEVKNAWYETLDRWKYSNNVMYQATALNLAGDKGEGLNDPVKRKEFRKYLSKIHPDKDYVCIQNELE